MKKRTIIYISGEGHSGTTLLDIILGSQKNAFSSGELGFFAQKGIKNNEYCACSNTVPDCEVWSQVIKEWEKVRNLGLDEYIQIQSRLTSKKNVLSSYFSLRNPSSKISYFLEDTNRLYDIIFNVTDSEIIIDSSKAPGRIQILKKLDYEIKVFHLIRRFGDVLNSYKKSSPKDLKKGVEHKIEPLSTMYVLTSWIFKNMLSFLFSNGISYTKVKYEEIVNNPEKELAFVTSEKEFANLLRERGPFYINHLVAGNKLRMKDHIYIAEKPMNTSYHRLKRRDKVLAKFIDSFY
mgnify:CR=1 FL=1